MGLAHSMSDSG